MTLLLAASRASRVSQIILPQLNKNGIVVADRHEASMLVYQHYCDGVEESLVRSINEHVTGGLQPDITFILDIPAEESFQRRISRLREGDRLSGWDARDYEFHRKSREAYLRLGGLEPNWVVLDGMKPPAEIADSIYRKVANLIAQKNG